MVSLLLIAQSINGGYFGMPELAEFHHVYHAGPKKRVVVHCMMSQVRLLAHKVKLVEAHDGYMPLACLDCCIGSKNEFKWGN